MKTTASNHLILAAFFCFLALPVYSQPANNNFGNAITLSGTNLTVNGSNVSATKEANEPNHGGNSGGASVWWKWTAPFNGIVTIQTAGSDFDTLLAVYTGSSLSGLILKGGNDDFFGTTSLVTFNVLAGTVYQIAVDGYGSDTGSIVLSLSLSLPPPPPSNNDFSSRSVIPTSTNSVFASNNGATKEPAEPNHGGDTGGASLWWQWTAANSGFVTIETEGSNFDTTLAVYVGNSISNLTLIGGDDDSWTDKTSAVHFYTVQGTTYLIAVDGWGGMWGNIRLNVRPGGVPAPSWQLPSPTGTQINSTNFSGKVVLLNFWATWCGPCVDEIPDIKSLQTQYGAHGLAVIGLSTDDASATVRDFMTHTPLNYTVAMSTTTVENNYGGIPSIPRTFVIDRENRILRKFVGKQTKTTFETSIVPALNDLRTKIKITNGTAVLSWPSSQTGYVLQVSSNLVSNSWATVTSGILNVNGYYTLNISNPPGPKFYRLKAQSGIIIDNSDPGFSITGTWSTGTTAMDRYGSDYRFHGTGTSTDEAIWSYTVADPGNFEVFAWWSQGSNRSTAAPYVVYHSTGSTTVVKNQQANGGSWQTLGIYSLSSGANQVRLGAVAPSGFVVTADAVKVEAR